MIDINSAEWTRIGGYQKRIEIRQAQMALRCRPSGQTGITSYVFERKMVGDPGIEPGVGLPGGVTVRCRTLQHVALAFGSSTERRVGIICPVGGVKMKIRRS